MRYPGIPPRSTSIPLSQAYLLFFFISLRLFSHTFSSFDPPRPAISTVLPAPSTRLAHCTASFYSCTAIHLRLQFLRSHLFKPVTGPSIHSLSSSFHASRSIHGPVSCLQLFQLLSCNLPGPSIHAYSFFHPRSFQLLPRFQVYPRSCQLSTVV